MALSERERSALESIARQVRNDDPDLFKAMSRHGEPHALAWPVALIAVCVAIFAVVLLTTGSPEALPKLVIR
jgi:hypothetical protein